MPFLPLLAHLAQEKQTSPSLNMRRTWIKRKTPLKRSKTRLRKESKQSISKIQRDLWQLCKAIIRAKYGNTCYTCGKTGLEGSGWQTGHFIPKSVGGALLKYHLNNLRPQCYRCNINLSGNGAVFYKLLVEREGQMYVDTLFSLKNQTTKAYDHYLRLIEEYTLLLPTNPEVVE